MKSPKADQGQLSSVRPHPSKEPQVAVSKFDQHGISGSAPAGWQVRAVNLSKSPGLNSWYHSQITTLGRAGPEGKFENLLMPVGQEIDEGDQVRVWAVGPDGNALPPSTERAVGVREKRPVELEGKDLEEPIVALDRIKFTATSNTEVQVSNSEPLKLVSEPGVTLSFHNLSTGLDTKITLNESGNFPHDAKIQATKDDSFLVRVVSPNFDTPLHIGIKSARPSRLVNGFPFSRSAETIPFSGPLFQNGIKPRDVVQGKPGTCYLAAAVAAIAHVQPERIKQMIRTIEEPNGDNHYEITFHQKNSLTWLTGKTEQVEIQVIPEFPVDVNFSMDKPQYRERYDSERRNQSGDSVQLAIGGGRPGNGEFVEVGYSSKDEENPSKTEMWYPLVESGYATLKGGYDRIASHGSPREVFEDILGIDSDYADLTDLSEDEVWKIVKTAQAQNMPVVLAVGPGRVMHAYAIVDAVESKTGERHLVGMEPFGIENPESEGLTGFSLAPPEARGLFKTIISGVMYGLDGLKGGDRKILYWGKPKQSMSDLQRDGQLARRRHSRASIVG